MTSTGRRKGRRIAILTYGTRGDVEPFVALGAGLTSAGHDVRLAAPAPFSDLALGHGLRFDPLPGDPGQLVSGLAERAGLSWPRMVGQMMQHVLPIARAVFCAAQMAAADAELIVHSFLMTDAGRTLARRRRIPDVSAQFFPMFLSTASFPAVAFPDLPLGGVYRKGSHALSSALFRYGSRWMYGKVRSSAPELPPLAGWPFAGLETDKPPVLLAWSQHVLPPPPEWPGFAHMTGYWQLPPRQNWRPPDELVRFLAGGARPIFFSPGSARTEDLRKLVNMVVSSARACGQRLILGLPHHFIQSEWEDVLVVDNVPHTWLFPKTRFVLHHGGAGTTGAAAESGVPNSAIPFTADQGFWARRIRELGLGPAAPPAQRLTRDRLEGIFDQALSDPSYERNAQALGEKVRGEDGVAVAVGVIQGLLGEDGAENGC